MTRISAGPGPAADNTAATSPEAADQQGADPGAEAADPGAADPEVQIASFTELDPATLYALLRLRVDVFVVEQRCPYPELDGRDTEPTTRHLWLPGDPPAGYLRLLTEPDGSARIGRVVVARPARRTGVAGRLLTTALALIGDRPCLLAAQTPLVDLYRRYGFAPSGPEFDEDGIAHLPMRRPPARAGR